uniref:Uncharacterized protein n=1 Tax=Auxenochlorella protothecoides TaxID=3075 RepID=A0A1D2A169_AUXPR
MAGEDIWSPNSQVPRTEVRVLWLAGWLLAMAFAVSPWGYTHLTVPSVSTPVTPARWTQDIWFVIFGLQAVGMVYQLLPSGYDPDGDKQRCVHATSFLWALGAMCTLGWLAALAQGTPGGTWLGLACILAALFITLRSLLHLYRLRRQFGRTSSRLLYLAYFLPTSMLAAWLTLAAATTAVAALIVSVSGSASRCRQLGGPQRCADPCPRLAGMLKGYFLHTPHPRWTQRTSTWRAWPSWQG